MLSVAWGYGKPFYVLWEMQGRDIKASENLTEAKYYMVMKISLSCFLKVVEVVPLECVTVAWCLIVNSLKATEKILLYSSAVKHICLRSV